MYGPALLADTLAECQALNLRPFLTWGTLLGHYRDGGFIAHDYDIDLGLLEDDFSRKEELAQAMKRRGYTVRANDDYFISFSRNRGKRPWIELQLFYRKNGQIACSIASSHWEDLYTYYFPADIFAEFMAVKFLGQLEVLIPTQTERFLTVAYGNWRIPQKSWHFLYGPLNLVQEKKEQ
jgi:phosphorylcholine metabolism protein LicD